MEFPIGQNKLFYVIIMVKAVAHRLSQQMVKAKLMSFLQTDLDSDSYIVVLVWSLLLFNLSKVAARQCGGGSLHEGVELCKY